MVGGILSIVTLLKGGGNYTKRRGKGIEEFLW